MELIAKYVYQVYKEKNFSRAAKALFISQPALSSAVSKHERELGFRIFDRTTIPLSLTPQGIIYIEALEEIMEAENVMERKIRELSDMSYGSITVGGSSYAAYCLLSRICGAFYKKYPDIKVTLDIGNVGKQSTLSDKLKSGELDLLVTYTNDTSGHIFVPLVEERLVIALNKNHPFAEKLIPYSLSYDQVISKNYPPEMEIRDMSIFKDIPFNNFEHNSNTGRKMAQMLGAYKITPYTIKNARHSGMHYNLMRSGVGAVVTTDLLVMDHRYDDILYFIPESIESRRKVYFERSSVSNENPIVNSFVSVAKEVCKNIYK